MNREVQLCLLRLHLATERVGVSGAGRGRARAPATFWVVKLAHSPKLSSLRGVAERGYLPAQGEHVFDLRFALQSGKQVDS